MTLEARVTALATTIAADIKNLRSERGVMANLTTTEKTNLVGALNELKGLIDSINASTIIDDVTASTSKTFSSSKITADIAAAVSALVNSSPAALDTLKELADALGSDANFAATTAISLGNRVRVDAAQSFTAPEQLQGRQNINAASATEFSALVTAIGNTDVDLAAAYIAARDAA